MVSINSDSHTVLDSVNVNVPETITYGEDNKRESDVSVATNEFDFAEGDVTYLSRADKFANYEEATKAPTSTEMSDEAKAGSYNVSNYDAKEANNCEVYNSDVLSLTGSASSTSVSSIQANDDIQVYVEKNRMKINGKFTSATVYDLTGKIIKNISNDGTEIILNTGIYIVAIDNTVTRKIIIL